MTTTKSFVDFSLKSVAEGTLHAVFCTLGSPDLDGDIIQPGAFTNGAPVVISTWNHGSWEKGQPPIGRGVIRVTQTEAILEGKLFMNTAAGREMFDVLKELGPLAEYSWSLQNVKSQPGTWNGHPVRVITSVDVAECSPVLRGAAGPGRSRTLAMKHTDLDPATRADLDRIARSLQSPHAAKLDEIYRSLNQR